MLILLISILVFCKLESTSPWWPFSLTRHHKSHIGSKHKHMFSSLICICYGRQIPFLFLGLEKLWLKRNEQNTYFCLRICFDFSSYDKYRSSQWVTILWLTLKNISSCNLEHSSKNSTHFPLKVFANTKLAG